MITKGELYRLLKDFPPDTPIMACVRYPDGGQTDTLDIKVMADMFLCEGEGCSHATPELDCEIVLFIDWGDEVA